MAHGCGLGKKFIGGAVQRYGDLAPPSMHSHALHWGTCLHKYVSSSEHSIQKHPYIKK